MAGSACIRNYNTTIADNHDIKLPGGYFYQEFNNAGFWAEGRSGQRAAVLLDAVLVRWGRFGDAWWDKPADAKDMSVFPIPDRALNANPLLKPNAANE